MKKASHALLVPFIKARPSSSIVPASSLSQQRDGRGGASEAQREAQIGFKALIFRLPFVIGVINSKTLVLGTNARLLTKTSPPPNFEAAETVDDHCCLLCWGEPYGWPRGWDCLRAVSDCF